MGLFDTLKVMKDIVKGGVAAYQADEKLDELIKRIKEDYKDKRFFFDLNDNMKKSRFAMSLYASHVIAHVLEL